MIIYQKRFGISRLAERLLASRNKLCSLELLNYCMCEVFSDLHNATDGRCDFGCDLGAVKAQRQWTDLWASAQEEVPSAAHFYEGFALGYRTRRSELILFLSTLD
jgi:hypothetical protein